MLILSEIDTLFGPYYFKGRDCKDKFVIAFLEDILIYSNFEEENERHLRMVLQVLRENQSYAKLRNACFIIDKYIIWAILFQRKGLQWILRR